MDKEFWLKKWELQDIAFHQASANPLLVSRFQEFAERPASRVESVDVAGGLKGVCPAKEHVWLLQNA